MYAKVVPHPHSLSTALANFLYAALKYSYYMLKAAWLHCLIGAAFASLKKISFGFFQSRLRRDRTERGTLCDNW
jgi:hypothetical protein